MKNNLFDKLLQEKALAHKSQVPADAWDNIQKNKKKRRYGVFFWLLPLLLIGFGLFGTYKYIVNKEESNKGNSITATSQPGTNKNAVDQTKEKNDISVIINDGAVIDSSKNGRQVKDTPASQYSARLINDMPDDKAVNKVENSISVSTGKKINAKDKEKYISSGKKKNKTEDTGTEIDAAANNKKNIVISKKSSPGKNKVVNAPKNGDVRAAPAESLAKRRNKKTNAKTKISITPATVGADDNEEEATAINETPVEAGETNLVSPKKDTAMITAKAIIEEKKDSTAPATTLTKKDDKKQKKIKSLLIDISASPFMPIQSNQKLLGIERTTIDPANKTVFKTNSIHSKLEPSIAFTISLRKQLNNKWGIAFGLQYARIKETIRLTGKETNTKYNFIKRLDPSGLVLIDDTVQVHTEGIRNIDAVNSYDFLTIPIAAQYKLYERNKWVITMNGGIYLNLSSYYKNSIQGNLEHHYASGAGSAKTKSKLTADIYSGLRLTRVVNKNMQLFAEPFLQFNFMRYNMSGMINNKNIHRAGINIGFSYSLKY